MLQLTLAYIFAAGMGMTAVYFARQNRKQGWQRPAPRWFGIELRNHEPAMPASLEMESASQALTPQLLRLNQELAMHGTPVKPEAEEPVMAESVMAELVSSRRV